MIGLKTSRWLAARRQVLLRRGIELVLSAALLTVALGFVSQIHPTVHSARPSIGPDINSASPDVALRAMTIAHQHLFGEPATLSQASPELNAEAVTITGIIYSTDPDDSRAMLLINGTTVIAAVGMQFSDGSKLTTIGPDRISMERDGISREIHFEIDTADPNAHFSVAALISTPDFADSASDGQQGASPPRILSPGPPMTQVYHAAAIPLSAIRGKDALARFKGLPPPVARSEKPARP